MKADAAMIALSELKGIAWPALADLAHIAATSHRTNTIARARLCIRVAFMNRYGPPPAMLLDALAHPNQVVREEATNALSAYPRLR